MKKNGSKITSTKIWVSFNLKRSLFLWFWQWQSAWTVSGLWNVFFVPWMSMICLFCIVFTTQLTLFHAFTNQIFLLNICYHTSVTIWQINWNFKYTFEKKKWCTYEEYSVFYGMVLGKDRLWTVFRLICVFMVVSGISSTYRLSF